VLGHHSSTRILALDTDFVDSWSISILHRGTWLQAIYFECSCCQLSSRKSGFLCGTLRLCHVRCTIGSPSPSLMPNQLQLSAGTMLCTSYFVYCTCANKLGSQPKSRTLDGQLTTCVLQRFAELKYPRWSPTGRIVPAPSSLPESQARRPGHGCPCP